MTSALEGGVGDVDGGHEAGTLPAARRSRFVGHDRRCRGIDVDRSPPGSRPTSPALAPPLRFELIAGGRSNLTFGVTDAAGDRYVLRRPPLGHVLATAHDMGREHRIISALGPTDVPVPPALGLCADESVNGAPFYVMGFVDGHVLRDAATAEKLRSTRTGRRRAGESLVDVLAGIHAVDVDAVGLGDLGKHEGYIDRQLKRWYGQFQSSNELTKRPVPLIHEVHDRLAAGIPEQQGVGHRPRRLPPRQLHARRRRRRRRRARLGDLHAGRPARRRRPAAGLLDRGSDPERRAARRAPTPAPGLPHPGRAGRPLRRPLATATCRASTSTWPSGTGSWPASSRASTPATPAGAMGDAQRLRGLREPRSTRLAQQAAAAADRAADEAAEHALPELLRAPRASPTSSRRSLVCVLDGWIDAGLGAQNARAALLDGRSTPSTVATFDADELLDHRARRPVMHLDRRRDHRADVAEHRAAGRHRRRRQRPPAARRRRARPPLARVLPRGRRPRASTSAPAWSSASAPTRRRSPTPGPPGWRRRRPTRSWPGSAPVRTTVDVPAGVQGAIERRAAEVGLPAIGLWAQVPHYVVGHAVARGVGRAARRARRRSPTSRCRRDELHRQAPELCAPRLDELVAGQPRAPRDGPPARGPVGRRGRRRVAGRPTPARASAPGRCRPATSWRPSSSGSSASRAGTRPAGQVRALGSAAMKVDGGISFDTANAASTGEGGRGRRLRRRLDGRDEPRPVPAAACSRPSTPSGSSSARRSPWPSPAAR